MDDTAALFDEFATGMRSVHGKLLLTGIPRITRPRKRKNTGITSGFTIVDPGGNWIRIFRRHTGEPETEADAETAGGPLARALQNAVVLGESKGDHRQAAKILDSGIARHSDAPAATLMDALVYRVELALRIDDPDHAETLLARVRDIVGDEAERGRLADTRARAAELERDLRAHRADEAPDGYP
ncbi:VOC family protein [Halostreptopolyspora alba]|uniref:VOC family protein n=1 Tax=Halostreptopolyspora alba TaxID=2487137 RepID=A0A3N0EDR5_9ACTN|nr:VOC family protein [Nocardiopsaceae bacterium YIM 96095]